MNRKREYHPLAPDVAAAIFDKTFNRNSDVSMVYNAEFNAVFEGGIALARVTGGKKRVLHELTEEESQNFMEALSDGKQWIDMFGIAPFRRSKTTTDFRAIVPDFNTGMWVYRMDADNNVEPGWRTHRETDGMFPGQVDYYPDQDVFIYIHQRPVKSAFPFRSLFAGLLDRLDFAMEMRQNTLAANFDASNPPNAMRITPSKTSVHDVGTESDHFEDAAQAMIRNRMVRAQREARYSAERAADDEEQFSLVQSSGRWDSLRETTGPNGMRVVINRTAGYMSRQAMLPAGREPVNVQLPAYNKDWMSEESFTTERIFAAMQWPNTISSSRDRGRNATSGIKYSEADRAQERRTVKQTRDQMRRMFRFLYRQLIRDEETQQLESQQKSVQRTNQHVREMLERVPSSLQKYLRWMEDRKLMAEHPAIRAQMDFEEKQAHIRMDSMIEEAARQLVNQAASRGEQLDMETTERHIRIMLQEHQEAMRLKETIEYTGDRVELVFKQEAVEDSELMMEMVERGLAPARESARSIFMHAGADEATADRISKEATGISPVEQEKLNLEGRKMDIEEKKLKLEKEKIEVSKIAAKNRPAPGAGSSGSSSSSSSSSSPAKKAKTSDK